MNTNVHELARPSGAPNFSLLRTLGVVTLLGSPTMLIEIYRHGLQKVANEDTDPVGALLYAAFSLCWLCAAIGLRRLRAAGHGKAAGLLMTALIVTVTFALGQSIMDLLKIPTSHPVYIVTDVAWPLSMLLTFTLSVASLFARVLPLWARLALVFCGISLPIGIVVRLVFGEDLMGAAFAWHTFLGWAGLGVVLLTTRPSPSSGR